MIALEQTIKAAMPITTYLIVCAFARFGIVEVMTLGESVVVCCGHYTDLRNGCKRSAKSPSASVKPPSRC